MAISNLNASHSYNGNGSSLGPHTINFDYFGSNDIIVYVDGVLKTISTHYTISNGSTSKGHYTGGTLTFTSGNAPAIGVGNIYIACDTDATQPLDVSTLNSFNEDQLEQVFDRLVLVARDAKEKANRSTFLAAENLEATFADYLADAEAAAVAAALSATNADTSEANADTSEANADISEAAAAAAAGSASAIAAGSLYAYTVSSGTVTAINGAGYEFNATGIINLPVPTTGHTVRAILASLSSASLTFVPTIGVSINGINDSRIVNENGIFFLIANGIGWTLTGSATGI